ncbi:MAG: nitroreductase family protein [Candidatus Firestonebacteria bacterium]
MSTYETILQRRTIRKFKQTQVPDAALEKLVNAARVSPSAGNIQPLQYIIVRDPELREALFKYLKWAAYLTSGGVPKPEERPTAYIIIILNNSTGSVNTSYDLGAAAMALLLAAWEEDIGGCWIRACDKVSIKKLLGVLGSFEVDSVIALGYKDELPVMEESDTEIKYWKDENGVLHVPKKHTDSLIHWEQY